MQVITTTAALSAATARFARHPYVAVDTEFLREQTYWSKLCLVQLAGPEDSVIVDPLAPQIDLKPLWALMADERVMKVFHAARQDVEIVWKEAGLIPKPLFDSQVAAMVCGFGEGISYVNLVKRITGADLDKSSRFTDWSRRPLSERQLTYALGDVTHLREVYQALNEELKRSGRSSWLDEEMAVLTSPSTYETKPEDAWKRLKTRVKSRRALAVLVELAAWRERLAQAQNVPRVRILRDEALYDIANQMPTDPSKFGELRTLSEGFGRSARSREVVEAVKRGLARDLTGVSFDRGGTSVSPEALAIVDLLKVALKAAAARHKVAVRLIADSEDLERIATEKNPDLPVLRGWRRELFGEDALAIKEGRLALMVRNGEVVLLPTDVPQ